MAPFEEPKELASTAPRKRRAAESLDLEEPATLVPRFRLLLPEEVVTGAHGDEGLYEGVWSTRSSWSSCRRHVIKGKSPMPSCRCGADDGHLDYLDCRSMSPSLLLLQIRNVRWERKSFHKFRIFKAVSCLALGVVCHGNLLFSYLGAGSGGCAVVLGAFGAMESGSHLLAPDVHGAGGF